MSIYVFLIVLATLPVLYFGARWSWLALPDRWRYKLRLAARRVYLVGPLAALAFVACDDDGPTVEAPCSPNYTDSCDIRHGDAGGGQYVPLCVNLQTDYQNCGVCGVYCKTGNCVGGVCK